MSRRRWWRAPREVGNLASFLERFCPSAWKTKTKKDLQNEKWGRRAESELDEDAAAGVTCGGGRRRGRGGGIIGVRKLKRTYVQGQRVVRSLFKISVGTEEHEIRMNGVKRDRSHQKDPFSEGQSGSTSLASGQRQSNGLGGGGTGGSGA